MSSAEQLSQISNPWEQVVDEVLSSQEYEPNSFDVYPIVGRISAGKNTIQAILEEWLTRDGFVVDLSSAGGAMRQHQIDTTGRRMRGHFTRPPEVDRNLDLNTARDLINPAHAGQLVLPEGRLLGYISSKVQSAAMRKNMPLPGNIHPILIEADENVRYEREYEKLHRDDPTITPHDAANLTLRREQGEDITFRTIYPELTFEDWYSKDFRDDDGNLVYELNVDTSEHSAAFSARKIYEFIKGTTVVPTARSHRQR